MKLYRRRSSNILTIATLACITLTVWLIMVISCGKLSDDNSPSSPVGTSGGVPIPIEPRSSLGTHTLSIAADPTTIPADGVNYSTITVTLQDASGRSVSGFTVNFTSDPIGFFLEDAPPLPPVETASTTAITDASGQASVRFYGSYSGYCAVKASVDLDENGVNDLFVTTAITLTSAGPPSSAGNYTLTLTAYPDTVPADTITYSTVVAQLTDSTGGSVENFEFTFTTTDLGRLSDTPEGSHTPTITSSSNQDGSSSVYFYGYRPGSAVVKVCVTVPDLYQQLCAKTIIHVTEHPGMPGPDVPGIFCNQPSPPAQSIKAEEDTGLAEPEDITLSAAVFEERGFPAAAGVRVDWSGDWIGYSYTDSTGVATLTVNPGPLPPGTYSYSVTSTVVINGVTYTCTSTFSVTVLPPDLQELTITLLPVPEEIEVTQQSTINIRVEYENMPLAGVTVGLQTTLGTLSSSSVVTDSFGNASVTLTAGTEAGTATIYATASTTLDSGAGAGGQASTEVKIVNVVDDIEFYPATIEGNVDLDADGTGTGTLNFLVRTLDGGGNPVAGVEVSYAITGTSGVDCGCLNFSPLTGTGLEVTDQAGYAEIEIQIAATCATIGCNVTIEVTAGDVTETITATVTAN